MVPNLKATQTQWHSALTSLGRLFHLDKLSNRHHIKNNKQGPQFSVSMSDLVII